MKKWLMTVLLSALWLSTVYGGVGSDLLDLPGLKAPEEDRQRMREAVIDVLENQPDKITVKWQGASSENRGIVQAAETFEKDGMQCRKLRIRSHFSDQVTEWVFNFCNTPDGWKIAN